MADFVSTIDPAGGGDFTTIAAWNSNLPSTINAGDRHIGELVDAVFDEHSLVIGSGVTTQNGEIILRAQNSMARTGTGFNGTIGSGPSIDPTGTPGTAINIIEQGADNVTFEDFEVTESFGANLGAALNGVLGGEGFSGFVARRLLVHSLFRGNTPAGIRVTDPGGRVERSIVWEIDDAGGTNSNGIVQGLFNGEDQECIGNTVHDCESRCYLFFGGGTFTGSLRVENCIGAANVVAAFGFLQLTGGGTLTSNNNLSLDDTADDAGGSGHVINSEAPSAMFVAPGSGNLRLKATATDPIDAGKDLGGSDGQAHLTIAGYDVAAGGVAWDIGADQEGLDANDNSSAFSACPVSDVENLEGWTDEGGAGTDLWQSVDDLVSPSTFAQSPV